MKAWAIVLLIVGPLAIIGGAVFYCFRPSPPASVLTLPDASQHPSSAKASKSPAPTFKSPPTPAAVPAPSIQLAPRSMVPPTPPSREVRPGKVSGSAWLTKNDSSSNLMRGMKVFLVPRDVSGSHVARLLGNRASEWRRLADDYRKLAAQVAATEREFPLAGQEIHQLNQKVIREHEQTASEYDATALKIESWTNAPPRTVDAVEAYKLLSETTIHVVPGFAPEKVSVEGKTSVNGKFILSATPGDYYLFAHFGSETAWVDWLVPLTVHEGDDLNVDLENENSIGIHNL